MMKQVKFTMPQRMLALICGLILSVTAFAQQITVNGHVKDATGEPIIGATVRVVGQDGGTVTDFDGNFTIKANSGATLSISYIGFTTHEVTAASNLVVTMVEDAENSLNEVVVIGYGRAKKTDLTGSVTAIKPDELSHGLQTSADDMLAGKVAGLNIVSEGGAPGSGSKIRIRGGSSLSASNDPLYVVDGLQLDPAGISGMNPLASINPNDIESFTVLKDASATAIYGSRASNGVIIITTKKGKAGQKAKVSYNGNVSVSVKKKTLDVFDGPGFQKFVAETFGEDSPEYGLLGYYDENGVMYDCLAEIEDISFPFGDAKALKPNASLDTLAKYLKNNRDAVVEIKAYCDAKGSAEYNLKLSKKRGQVVYNYLLQHGVQPKQMVVNGLGEENPISFNIINGEYDDESKAYNRRVEFRMKQQGSKETLLIRPLTTVPDKYLNPLYQKDYEKAPGTPESEI